MSDDARRDAARGREAAQTGTAKGAAQPKAAPRSRPRSEPAVAPAASRSAPDLKLQGSAIGTPQVQGAAQPGMSMGQAKATAGADGGLNITVQKFWQPVGNDLPAGYDVATLPGHTLEVTLEQLAYRRTYSGVGSVRTGLTPVAPIGTQGRMLARDLTTGETLEQPWTWQLIGGSSGFGGFWAALKRALWKG